MKLINDIQVKAIIYNARIARLATVDSKSNPHLVPVVFAFDGEHYYIPIDKKTKQEPSKSEKLKRSQEHSDKSKYCITYRWIQRRLDKSLFRHDTGKSIVNK